MKSLVATVRQSFFSLEKLLGELEAFDQAERLSWLKQLRKTDMKRLWDACEGRETSSKDFVPEGLDEGSVVIHHGKNTLPLISAFQKRFVRGKDDRVYGYNHVGLGFSKLQPGYFVGHHRPHERMYGLDYYMIPPARENLPKTWPALRPNTKGLQRFIYGHMVDYMRLIVDGMTIGRAWRGGQKTDNFFVLVREEKHA